MNLLVLIHGFGSDGQEMRQLFPALEQRNDLEILALDAPHPCDLSPQKRQWFKLSFLNSYLAKEIERGAHNIVHDIRQFIEQRAIDYRQVIVCGHSQGAMIASYMAFYQLFEGSHYVCASSLLPFLENAPCEPTLNKVHFLHGEQDNMIRLVSMLDSLSVLHSRRQFPALTVVPEASHAMEGSYRDAIENAIIHQLDLAQDFVEPVRWKGENLDIAQHLIPLEDAQHTTLSYLLNGKEDVDMQSLQQLMQRVRVELDYKHGFCVLEGLNEICYTLEEYTQVGHIIGNYLGVTVPQNLDGAHCVLVQDVGQSILNPTHRGHRTSDALGFHNDRCDRILLVCAHQATVGGESSLVSCKYVHDLLLERAPHHLKTLYGEFPNHRRGEERPGEAKWCMMPVFAITNGQFVCRYVRRFIEDSQKLEDAPRLTTEQTEAMDYLDHLLNDPDHFFEFKLQKGQVLVINNHTLLHGRSNYVDNPGEEKRTLIRLWLAHADSRPLPKSFESIYRNVEAGAVRGGI
jgi:predicted esterase